MADQGIVERLRVRQREWEDDFEWMNGGRDSLKRAKEYQEAADTLVMYVDGMSADKSVLIREIAKLRAEIARLTDGAIEGWVIPIEYEHPLLKEWLVSSHRCTGLGEREQRPCKLIIDTQGEDE